MEGLRASPPGKSLACDCIQTPSLFPCLQNATEPGAPSSPRRRPRLLVVEDDPACGGFLREILEADYEVAMAADGEQGWEAAQHAPPDLILSDVRLPGVDGITLTRRLRTAAGTARVPIILLTTCNDAEARWQALEAGADELLLKPFRVREVLVAVRERLGARWAGG